MVKTVCETHFANHDLAADNTEHEINDKRASFDIDRKCPTALMHASVSKKKRNNEPKPTSKTRICARSRHYDGEKSHIHSKLKPKI